MSSASHGVSLSRMPWKRKTVSGSAVSNDGNDTRTVAHRELADAVFEQDACETFSLIGPAASSSLAQSSTLILLTNAS